METAINGMLPFKRDEGSLQGAHQQTQLGQGKQLVNLKVGE